VFVHSIQVDDFGHEKPTHLVNAWVDRVTNRGPVALTSAFGGLIPTHREKPVIPDSSFSRTRVRLSYDPEPVEGRRLRLSRATLLLGRGEEASLTG